MKTFIYYFMIFLIISIIIKLISIEKIIPIENKNKMRLFGILPVRELIIIPPISFLVLLMVYKYLQYDINMLSILSYSVMYMFITGILMHILFGVKTRVNYLLGLSKNVDGTGIAPYGNY